MLLQFAEQALHLSRVKAIKIGRGCAVITKSLGYHQGFLLWWVDKSDDIQQEELVAISDSQPVLNSINLRKSSQMTDWQRISFILVLSIEGLEGQRAEVGRTFKESTR